MYPEHGDFAADSFIIDNGILKSYIGKDVDIVTIPDGVTAIAEYAFAHSDVKSIILPESVNTIYRFAFSDCERLFEISVPKSVTCICRYAFSGSNVKRIIISADNHYYHYAGNCLIATKSKELIAGCSDSVIPDDGSVRKIAEGAFQNCEELKSVTIGKHIQIIDAFAFDGCTSLMCVRILNGLIAIKSFAFASCVALPEITIPKSVCKIAPNAFLNCKKLLCYGLRNDIKFAWGIEWSFEGCEFDVVPFSLLERSSTKNNCVLMWLKGNHRRKEDDDIVIDYIQRHRRKILNVIAERGNLQALTKFKSILKKPSFSLDALNKAVEISNKNTSVHQAIIDFKNDITSSG